MIINQYSYSTLKILNTILILITVSQFCFDKWNLSLSIFFDSKLFCQFAYNCQLFYCVASSATD